MIPSRLLPALLSACLLPGLGALETVTAERSANMPKITHDWPCYSGPLGTFADETKTPLLNDFSQAKLVWKSEDKSIGWGKTTSGERTLTNPKRAPGLYHSGQGSLIVAGGLVIAGYFIPSGDVIAKASEGVAPEFRQRALIGADDVILAVDTATGKTKWKQIFAGKGINAGSGKRPTYGATPAAAQGKVFHIGTTGRIYCVDLADGKPVWESFIGTEAPKLIDEHAAKTLADTCGYGLHFLQYLQVCDQVLLVPAGDKLVGFDIATGKRWWECAGVLSGGNVPSPVTIENQRTLFCVNAKGEMRLMEAKTGKILWTKATSPSISHLTQAVAADGKAFMWNPGETVVENGKNQLLGKPACYELKLDGAKLLWELPGNYQHVMGGDGGQCAKIGYRDGRAYFGTSGKSGYAFVAVNVTDGKILGNLTKAASYGSFSLWGDKFVMTGDNSHESMGSSCDYTPHTLELAPTGKSYSPRGKQGVSGYIFPMRDPFADGFQFTKTATGQIWCYDLRAQPQ